MSADVASEGVASQGADAISPNTQRRDNFANALKKDVPSPGPSRKLAPPLEEEAPSSPKVGALPSLCLASSAT